jgi:phosphonate transport system substrate-binding protein
MRAVILAIIFLLFHLQVSVAKDLVYIPLPLEDKESVVADQTPMINYLAEKLGVSIRIRYEKDYDRILKLFKEGEVDLVQLGPLPYWTLKKEYPQAQPLAIMNEADGKAFYTCALVTSFDGPQSVQDIRSPLALPQPLSTCGYFSARLLLHDHNPDLEQLGYCYLGNHSNVALSVIRGELKTGIMKTSVAKKYDNLTLKILQETPSLPGFVIVGNSATMQAEQLQQLGQILIQADAQTRSSWVIGIDGFSVVSDQDFALFNRHEK